MRLKHEASAVPAGSALIERLESRSYLSADLVAGAIATPLPAGHATHASSRAGVFSPSKVTKPVDLSPQIVGIVKRAKNGLYIVVQLVVNNAGPATATGSLRVGVEFSYYKTGAGARVFRTVNTPIKIVAGGSKTLRIGGTIPKSFPTFDYHMVVILNGKKSIPETNYSNDTQVTAYFFYLA